MNDASDTESNEEERPIFCPYNQESLLAAEARIAQAEIKKNERKKKREEGEVLPHLLSVQLHFNSFDYSSIQYFVSLFFFQLFLMAIITSCFLPIQLLDGMDFSVRIMFHPMDCMVFLIRSRA